MHIISYQRSLKKQKKYSISREIEISNTAAIGDSGVEQFFSEIFSDKNDCIKYFSNYCNLEQAGGLFFGILFLEWLALFSFQRRVKSMKLAVNFGNPFPLFLYIGWLICWLCMRNLLFLLVCLFVCLVLLFFSPC